MTVPVTNGSPSSAASKHNLPAHFIGGNHLDVAPAGPVKDFVTSHEGHTVITSVGSGMGKSNDDKDRERVNECADDLSLDAGPHCQ